MIQDGEVCVGDVGGVWWFKTTEMKIIMPDHTHVRLRGPVLPLYVRASIKAQRDCITIVLKTGQ